MACVGIIVAINLFLEKAIIKLCSGIGYASQSKLMKTITTYIFIAKFINTGLLITLGNMKIHLHVNDESNYGFISHVLE